MKCLFRSIEKLRSSNENACYKEYRYSGACLRVPSTSGPICLVWAAGNT